MLGPTCKDDREAQMPQSCSIEKAVDEVLARLPAHIHMGLPLGLGKPNAFVNALYARVRQLPQRRLTIYTARSAWAGLTWVTACSGAFSNRFSSAYLPTMKSSST